MRHNGYVNYDDGKYISENQQVKEGLSIENVKRAFTKPHFFMWHPLTTISYLAEYEFFGANPFASHLINLAIHIINVLLVFFIFMRIGGTIWASFIAAAVFAVHPLQVESVAWAAERKNVISGMFWLLTVWAYIRYSDKRTPNIRLRQKASSRQVKLGALGLTILFFILAAMSKPIVVTLPFVLLLLDFWPLGRMTGKTIGRLVIEKIPMFVIAAALSAITIIAQKSGGVINTMPQFAFQYRLENAIVSYMNYLIKFFYPLKLAVFYPYAGPKMEAWQPIIALIILTAATIIVFYFGLSRLARRESVEAGRQRRYLITGWLWFLGTLVPVIGIIQAGAQSMADRYMYLPMIGILIIVSMLISEAARKRRYVLFVSAAIVFVLIIMTRCQVRYWYDDFTLFGQAISVTENNENMQYNSGYAYQQKGQFEKAIEHYSKALQIEPEKADTNYNIAVSLYRLGRYDEAIKHFKTVLEAKKEWNVYNYLGGAYTVLRKYNSALDCYREGLKLKPGDVNIESNIALSLMNLGRQEEANQIWRNILAKDPQNIKAKYWLENTNNKVNPR